MTEAECVSLRDYIDMQIATLEKATGLARDEMNRRLEGMNELREAMKDQAANFATRVELALLIKDVQSLQLSRAASEGKASQAHAWLATMLAVVALLLSLWKTFSG